MSDSKANRQEKDALFKVVFGEHPENALSLYNAINGTAYTNVQDLSVTTLRDTVYIGIKNDVSFLFNHDMNLYEHQSSYCPNMPLRGLGYFSDLYKKFLGGEDSAKERMYDKKLLLIPAPRYYVFYNGIDAADEDTELCLSNAYEGKGDIEVVAHMLNVNKGHNQKLMDECRPLAEYSEFIFRLRENLAQGLTKEEAADTTIDSCIQDNILAELLKGERARMRNILIEGLTEEEREHLHEMQLERVASEGRAEGELRIIRMNDYLISQDRIKDLQRATIDETFRDSILAEMDAQA